MRGTRNFLWGALSVAFAVLVTLSFVQGTVWAATPSAGFLKRQGPAPPGANEPGCHPSPRHPEPVVLVPGTFESMAQNWAKLSPELAARGYCVYSLNYGVTAAGYSTGPIQQSAGELRSFVNHVLRLTGARKVDIVGHSQGGMMPRYYIKFLGGAKVDDLVALTPSNHGTKNPGAFATGLLGCVACRQQMWGSPFLRRLNSGDETPGGVSYTVITTRYDDVVVPYTSAFLKGPASRVSNITIQDYYPLDTSDHLLIPYDERAYTFIFDALSHPGPARP